MIGRSQDFLVTQFQIGVSPQGVVWSVLKAHIEKKFLLPLVFLLNKSQSSIIPYKSSDYTEQNEYNLKITKKNDRFRKTDRQILVTDGKLTIKNTSLLNLKTAHW